MSTDSLSYDAPWPARLRARSRPRVHFRRLLARPELLGLVGVAAVLNLWSLSINGWANAYYSAAVRSMSTSWHDFLFVSLDKSGLMTVDKPPLSLWVQALSARVFGLHPLSLLVPQALMGVIAVALLYDLTRRRFGRAAGFVAGLALATTPVVVAVSRHNNPDELLLLCCVAALWLALRALESGRTRWLVLSGVAVGLGFETKMGVALMVVPGIVLAWIWTRVLTRPGTREKLAAFGQLLSGGAAMLLVGGAWPLLVTLTPASDRPWISGTSDNSIWSLIFGYNGLGRVAGQTGGPAGGGGPGGGGGTLFGGSTGPFRLLQSGLGDQAGWWLGFALVSGVGLLALTRLRRRDPRTAWLLAVGGSFLCTAVVFSFASGIFHPYYVSLLAPFAAALIGAGVGEILPAPLGRAGSARVVRLLAPLAVAAGAATELIVLGGLGGRLSWATPLVLVLAVGSSIALSLKLAPRLRAVVLAIALAGLFAAPVSWAAQTLGHATNGTFPAGGPASTALAGGPGGPGGPGPGGPGARFGARGGFGPRGGFPPGGPPAARGTFGPPPGAAGGQAGGGGRFGGAGTSLTAAVRYVASHGGGTIAVSSQSSAASAIVSSGANVAGIGGFSGRESSVTTSWLAAEVRAGRLRWVLVDSSGGRTLPGDTRTGSQTAINAVQSTCRAVKIPAGSGTSTTIYDCLASAGSLLRASTQGAG
jgi:4-amino-4-deoxy-L-arabinose transferase-like glycosyltransferase